MANFIPGLELCEIFYNEAVQLILKNNFRDLKYSAGLIGPGSEVLGFDTAQSMDHHWGPKTQIFVSDEDHQKYAEVIKEALRNKLPYEIRRISTNFGDPDGIGVQLLEKIDKGPVSHLVSVHTIKQYFEKQLGQNPYELKMIDWLVVPEQKLLEVTAGKVFYDGLGELNVIREKLAYYPRDIWLYVLASQWIKISQEEAFVGRCGDVGDELGSQIVASRLVRELMKLCFYMEKKYIPYMKWFGTAFSRLSIASELTPLLRNVLLSKDWKERENNLSKVYEVVAIGHNALGITKQLSAKTTNFYNRPYLVIHADTFANAIRNEIKDEDVRKITINIGNVSQFIDSTDLLDHSSLTHKLEILF